MTTGISVGARPGSIAFGSEAVWVANLDDQTVSRIDPNTRRMTRTLPVVDTPTGLAAADSSVWVVGSDPRNAWVRVRKIDPRFDTVGKPETFGNVVPGGPGSAAALRDTVGIAPSSGLLSRLETRTNRVLRVIISTPVLRPWHLAQTRCG